MARRISKFSERDHVRFKFVPIGEEFLYNGSKIRKTADPPAMDPIDPGAGYGKAGIIKPHTRVAITRASGLGRLNQNRSAKYDR